MQYIFQSRIRSMQYINYCYEDVGVCSNFTCRSRRKTRARERVRIVQWRRELLVFTTPPVSGVSAIPPPPPHSSWDGQSAGKYK
jgi:hypothetical protein